jgi:hypothetical protein
MPGPALPNFRLVRDSLGIVKGWTIIGFVDAPAHNKVDCRTHAPMTLQTSGSRCPGHWRTARHTRLAVWRMSA